MNLRAKLLTTTVTALMLATNATAQSAEANTTTESYLFVQHADKAMMSDGVLSLEGPDKNVIIFTDRPHRAASSIPAAELLKIWDEGQDSFASDPPNAALVGQANGDPVSLVVELTNPKVGDGGTFTFDYSVIDGNETAVIEQSYLVIDSFDPFDALMANDVADIATALSGDSGPLALEAEVENGGKVD